MIRMTSPRPQGCARGFGIGFLAAATAYDLLSAVNFGQGIRLPPIVLLAGFAAVLWRADRRPPWLTPQVRTAVPAALSVLYTAGVLVTDSSEVPFGTGEAAFLLTLLFVAVRHCPWPWALLCGVLDAVALLLLPVRAFRALWEEALLSIVVGLILVGVTAGLAAYLRSLDYRRTVAVGETRRAERIAIAADLNDFVAHHVTGIIVQANAALALQHTAPEQVGPLLENITRSGSETLDSMRRLVRVLREDDHEGIRPGEVWAELARLVSAFSEDEADVQLHVAAAAREARLAPEVETSVHRVVQEALTNVRRHAHGAVVAVRVDMDGPRLRVEVHNTAPAARHPGPVGGRGGFGLVGLRERVEAVEGALTAAPTDDGGWRVTADFPMPAAMAGSPA